MRQLKIAVELP